MAWNEPGGNDNDPWGNRKNDSGGPPDLDEVFKNLKNWFDSLTGKKNSGGGANRSNNSGGGLSGGGIGGKGIALLGAVLGRLCQNHHPWTTLAFAMAFPNGGKGGYRRNSQRQARESAHPDSG